MGLKENYSGETIFLDAAPLIYYIEGYSVYNEKLRAFYYVKTPVAIQIAMGIEKNANYFLTKDNDLKRVMEIPVLTLEEM